LEYVLDNYDKKQTEGLEAAKLLAYIKAKG
jgi:hypothetical protein